MEEGGVENGVRYKRRRENIIGEEKKEEEKGRIRKSEVKT